MACERLLNLLYPLTKKENFFPSLSFLPLSFYPIIPSIPPSSISFFPIVTGAHYIALAGLELSMLPKLWIHRDHLAYATWLSGQQVSTTMPSLINWKHIFPSWISYVHCTLNINLWGAGDDLASSPDIVGLCLHENNANQKEENKRGK